MIYFVRCAARNAIKIGMAEDPSKRLRALQTACPDPLEMLGTVPGERKQEKEFHRKFTHLRILGEWFRADQDLIETIELLTRFSEFKDMPRMIHGRQDMESYLRNSRDIERWIAKKIGFRVGFYQGTEPWLTGAEDRDLSFQVMPVDEDDCLDFWIWQADCEQWFATLEEAAKSFVLAFMRWTELRKK